MEGLGFVLGGLGSSWRGVKVPLDQRTQKCVAAVTSSSTLRMTIQTPPSAPAGSQTSVESQSVKDTYDDYVMNTYGRYPLVLTRGQSAKVWDEEGKLYYDFVSGIATCSLGHASPILNKAISDQLARLHHCSNLFFIPEQAQLAQLLVENSVADKAFFCNSGAEANEAAIKVVRKYAATRRGVEDGVILTANQSFHGRTMATISATGQPKYQKNFSPLVPGFDYIDFNDMDSLRAAFEKHGDRVIGVMLEACQGEGGVNPGTKEYFAAVRKLCDEHDAALIMDEVQVGVGRSGTLWGYEQLDVKPDVFTIAKGLGGGIPIGAMLCSSKLNVFEPGDHASTFGGNPLSCAAGIAVLKTVTAPGFLQGVQTRAHQLRKKLQALAVAHPGVIKEVRGWGLLVGLELEPDCGLVSADFVRSCIAAGLLVVPAGPSVVRFLPPLVITEEEMTEAMQRFEGVMTELTKA